MKAAFIFSCSFLAPFFSAVLPPAAGKPLEAGSPGRVFAVHSEDVILPCRSTAPVNHSRVTAVEWLRVDGPDPLTVHVERNGQELLREKAAEYWGRTAVLDNGSLKLLGVTQQDTGTYRCVLLRGAATKDEVSLIVGEVPEVNVTLRRTSANEMFVHWESSGWFLKPHISLLDAERKEIHAHAESSLGPDDLYSVRAQVDAATANGTGIIICRVEIPGTSVRKERQISIIDEFNPPVAGLRSYVVLVFVVLLCVLVSAVVFFVPIDVIEKLRSSLQHLIANQKHEGDYGNISTTDPSGPSSRAVDDNQLSFKGYGDITQVTTTGSSKRLSVNGQCLTGVDASHELAMRHLEEAKKYKEELIRVGEKLSVHPALIAAIISRQSGFGADLKLDGYGKGDGNCYGLMQINKHYHAVKGGPYSEEHLDQGVTFLIQLIKTMERNKQNWTKEKRLKGALASYIAGEEKVLPLTYEELDSVTPCGDFANDVVARAQWFAQNAF